MFVRSLLVLVFFFGLSSRTYACSCAPWSGHVSDFTESYVSVWAVPTEGSVVSERVGRPSDGVNYTVEVLEGFNRIIQSKINLQSSVADGGSCGVQLTLGLPQFISAYKYNSGRYRISTCTPDLPYAAVKLYLETGQDTFIPEWGTCYSWAEDSTVYTPPIFNEEREECSVWKGVYYNSPKSDPEREDWKKYRQIWWDKIKSTTP